MKYDIKIEKIWSKLRNDSVWVVLKIEHNNNIFRFLPKYKDVAKIYILLIEAEKINKGLVSSGIYI